MENVNCEDCYKEEKRLSDQEFGETVGRWEKCVLQLVKSFRVLDV